MWVLLAGCCGARRWVAWRPWARSWPTPSATRRPDPRRVRIRARPTRPARRRQRREAVTARRTRTRCKQTPGSSPRVSAAIRPLGWTTAESPASPGRTGNDVTPLVHGAAYFPELLRCVQLMRSGDLLLFTDWRGDPDELLDGPGTGISQVLCDAAGRGVLVKGLIWRSHLDRFAFSEQENRHLGEEIEAAGGECLLDMRVRPGGSHHQKFIVLRHPAARTWTWPSSAASTCATAATTTPSTTAIPSPSRSPRLRAAAALARRATRSPGPAVADVETVFRERWDDPRR